ncbi:MAG: DUF4935 domain-containing protein [Acidobacteria bacterium]|nr:DUF4935 domain-containing protein [Acidobacteriota bacterium]
MTRLLECWELVREITTQPCPLLFLDTCSVLDIFRSVYRDNIQSNLARSAADLVTSVQSSARQFHVVVTDSVLGEFNNNRANVNEELAAEMAKLRRSMKRVSSAVEIFFPDRRVIDPGWPSPEEIKDRLLTVVDQLISVVTVLRESDECKLRAVVRVRNRLPPARLKQQVQDCVIFESFLDLVRQTRAEGFTGPAIFVTSNSTDYGKPPGEDMISSDLAQISALYADDISRALAESKKTPA